MLKNVNLSSVLDFCDCQKMLPAIINSGIKAVKIHPRDVYDLLDFAPSTFKIFLTRDFMWKKVIWHSLPITYWWLHSAPTENWSGTVVVCAQMRSWLKFNFLNPWICISMGNVRLDKALEGVSNLRRWDNLPGCFMTLESDWLAMGSGTSVTVGIILAVVGWVLWASATDSPHTLSTWGKERERRILNLGGHINIRLPKREWLVCTLKICVAAWENPGKLNVWLPQKWEDCL